MPNFKLHSPFKPTGDQPAAIEKLAEGLKKNFRDQTLVGVTGSGKTFTMANVIAKANKPTLVISHNKTLAAQLASEFKEFFPENAVHYFVSYYDYYQPEAYIPRTDTYIEKETQINEEIDRLRHAATHSLLTRSDVIIVASVSCIYGLGRPEEYARMAVPVSINQKNNKSINQKSQTASRTELLRKLTAIQYERNDIDFHRGTYRVKGEVLEIFPAYAETAYRVEFNGNDVEKITEIDHLTGKMIEGKKPLDQILIFPAKHFVVEKGETENILKKIEQEAKERVAYFNKKKMPLEAERIESRVKYDLEMMRETGYCNGIENYSRHFSGRNAGEPPYTLIDYFSLDFARGGQRDFLMFIDESHITIPQIGGMYGGDRSRKETLIEHGFRLPSAYDNRPLTFDEFDKKIKQAIYVSATPREYELNESKQIVEQVIRPTGLLDPAIEVRKTDGQIDDLIKEINATVKKGQRVLVTTLTKRLAEELTEFLKENKVKVQYLHSEVETLERLEILRDLRLGKYDVLVGINLLREGLDLPEVSLVAILDADKEGFLRTDSALIQTMGRAARHVEGKVIMYADTITGSMKKAMEVTKYRRAIQERYNKKHNITPTTIKKAVANERLYEMKVTEKQINNEIVDTRGLSKRDIKRLVKELENEMKFHATNMEFEKAAILRDKIKEIKSK